MTCASHRVRRRGRTVIPLAVLLAVLLAETALVLGAPDRWAGDDDRVVIVPVPAGEDPSTVGPPIGRAAIQGADGAAADCATRSRRPGAELAGTLGTTVASRVDSSGDGLPLASARVSVLPVAAGLDPRHTTTGSDGSFSLSGVRPGPYELRVEHDGWPTLRMNFEAGVDRCTLPQSLHVECGRARGRCTTRGLAVSGAQVEVVDGRGPTRSLAARTATDGRFVFERLAPGRCLVRARPELSAPWASCEVEVTAGLELELELDLPVADPLALRGLVSGLPAGVDRARLVLEPVAAAWLPHWEPVAVEVLHGAFSAVVPGAGEYAYRLVWGGGEHEGTVEVRAHRTRVAIEIPSGCLQVWLVGEDAVPATQPVRLLRIPADGVATVVRERGDATTPDATGRLVLDHLPAGDYAVACTSAARDVRSEVVTLFPGAGRAELVFVVPR